MLLRVSSCLLCVLVWSQSVTKSDHHVSEKGQGQHRNIDGISNCSDCKEQVLFYDDKTPSSQDVVKSGHRDLQVPLKATPSTQHIQKGQTSLKPFIQFHRIKVNVHKHQEHGQKSTFYPSSYTKAQQSSTIKQEVGQSIHNEIDIKLVKSSENSTVHDMPQSSGNETLQDIVKDAAHKTLKEIVMSTEKMREIHQSFVNKPVIKSVMTDKMSKFHEKLYSQEIVDSRAEKIFINSPEVTSLRATLPSTGETTLEETSLLIRNNKYLQKTEYKVLKDSNHFNLLNDGNTSTLLNFYATESFKTISQPQKQNYIENQNTSTTIKSHRAHTIFSDKPNEATNSTHKILASIAEQAANKNDTEIITYGINNKVGKNSRSAKVAEINKNEDEFYLVRPKDKVQNKKATVEFEKQLTEQKNIADVSHDKENYHGSPSPDMIMHKMDKISEIKSDDPDKENTVKNKHRHTYLKKIQSHRQKSKSAHDILQQTDENKIEEESAMEIDDRWSRKGLSQVPDVARLERRLHPSVSAPASDIVRAMEGMMLRMQSSLRRFASHYDTIANMTRWNYIISVRDNLNNLAKENDKIYDVVMKVSLLTKEIYMHAHGRNGSRTGRIPAASTAASFWDRPINDIHKSISINYNTARAELQKTQNLVQKVKENRHHIDRMRQEFVRIETQIKDRLPSKMLADLNKKSTQIVQQLNVILMWNADGAHLYGHMYNHTDSNKRSTDTLIAESRKQLAQAESILEVNKRILQELHTLNRTQSSSGLQFESYDEHRLMLWVKADGATYHAEKLFEASAFIHMKLEPVVEKAKQFVHRKGDKKDEKTESSVHMITNTIERLSKAMHQIQILVGYQYVSEPCDDVIVEGSGSSLTGDTTDVKCKSDGKVDGGEEEGSGELDTDINILDTAKSMNDTVPDTIHIVNETVEGDIIPEGSGETDIDVNITDTTRTLNASITDKVKINNETIDGDIIKDTDGSGENDIDISVKGMDRLTKDTILGKVSTLKETDDEDILKEMVKTGVEQQSMTSILHINSTNSDTQSKTTDADHNVNNEDFLIDDSLGFFMDQPLEMLDSKIDQTVVKHSLNKLILERLSNYSHVSTAVHAEAQKVEARHHDLLLKWEQIKKNISQVENKTVESKSFVSLWKAKQMYFRAVHEMVQTFSKEVNVKKDIIDSQCDAANKRASAKLSKMQKAYEDKTPSEENAIDPKLAKESIDATLVVKNNVRDILSLKKVLPNLCQSVENYEVKIRANIAELKKKIEKAKLIVSALQIPLTIPSDGHMDIPVILQQSPENPLRSSFEMAINSAVTDGQIFLIHMNNSDSVVFSLKNKHPTLVASYSGDKSSTTAKHALEDDVWYNVQLERFASSYTLTIRNDSFVMAELDAQPQKMPDASSLLATRPMYMRVGGSGKSIGCFRDALIENYRYSIYRKNVEEKFPEVCTSMRSYGNSKMELLLDGSGFVSYELGRQAIQSLELTFKANSDGTLLNLKIRAQRIHVDARIWNGFLVIYISNMDHETLLKSTMEIVDIYSTLRIEFIGSQNIHVQLNNKTDQLVKYSEKFQIDGNRLDVIYIGGLELSNSSFSGCIKALMVNNKEVTLSSMTDVKGANFGTCVVKNCITFKQGSLAIKMLDLKQAYTVNIAIKKGALGILLQYSKSEKFNVVVSIEKEVIKIEEKVKENEESIKNIQEDTIIITLHDDKTNKKVYVTVGSIMKEFSYWYWSWFSDDNVLYNLYIGGGSEASSTFQGSILDTIVDGKPVQLKNHLTTNNLARCGFSGVHTVMPSKAQGLTELCYNNSVLST